MRTIYVDSENKCHVRDDDTMTPVETTFFDGKCDFFIEGYCYDVGDGYITAYPWKDSDELDGAQREYERAELAQLKNIPNDLNTSYQEGINSI